MKITPGPAIAAASGSVGGSTFSRNRYGAYVRNRAIPVNPGTSYQLQARAFLGNLSTAWGGLTAAQQLAWNEWAKQNPIVDALGQVQVLAGNAAYIQLNARILQDGGTAKTTPPIVTAPDALVTLAAEGDIGMGDFELNWTPTPLGAAEKLWIQAAVTNSTGINYVRNLLRFVGTSAAAQAAPFDPQTLIEARFGALVVGVTVHYLVSVFDTATGLLSPPLRTKVVVSST